MVAWRGWTTVGLEVENTSWNVLSFIHIRVQTRVHQGPYEWAIDTRDNPIASGLGQR